MNTYLVTGGAGFIGGNFVLGAVQGGTARVVNLDLLTYAGHLQTLAPISEHDAHVFIHGDIADRPLVDRLFQEHKPQAVINFAAESHVDRSIEGPGAFVQTNVVGTLNVLESALAYWRELDEAGRDKFRFLHVSTDEVYGSLGETGRFTEASPYQPNSPYAASKAAADHLVRAFHHTYGFPTLTTNCSNNYGPYQFPEKLIPLMIAKAMAGGALPIYGDGKNVRDWLYVRDHCAAIQRVLDKGQPGQVYNIGGDAQRSNLELVHRLCEILDERRPDGAPHDRLIKFVADRPGHDRRYAIDASRIRDQLGWEPEQSFESGLARTVDWYLDNSSWCEQVQADNYEGERLGVV